MLYWFVTNKIKHYLNVFSAMFVVKICGYLSILFAGRCATWCHQHQVLAPSSCNFSWSWCCAQEIKLSSYLTQDCLKVSLLFVAGQSRTYLIPVGTLKCFCICQLAYVTLCGESLFQAMFGASTLDTTGHIICYRLDSETIQSINNTILLASCGVRPDSACWEPWRCAEVCQHDECKSQFINQIGLQTLAQNCMLSAIICCCISRCLRYLQFDWGQHPYGMTQAADCLSQWATGNWDLQPPLKVNWLGAQIFYSATIISLTPSCSFTLEFLWASTCSPRSLPAFGPAVGPGAETGGLDMVQNLEPVTL